MEVSERGGMSRNSWCRGGRLFEVGIAVGGIRRLVVTESTIHEPVCGGKSERGGGGIITIQDGAQFVVIVIRRYG